MTKRLERTLKYQAHRVKVYEDTIELPDGQRVLYDYVENRDGAGILLVNDKKQLILVRQYRNVLDDYDLEIPAGCREACDHSFEETAIREAEEETGLIPARLIKVTHMVASVGLFSERTSVYIGTELKVGRKNPDFDENIELEYMNLDEAMRAIDLGMIVDSKTIIAILRYRIFVENGLL